MQIYRLQWNISDPEENYDIASGKKTFLSQAKADDFEMKMREAAAILNLGSCFHLYHSIEEVEE